MVPLSHSKSFFIDLDNDVKRQLIQSLPTKDNDFKGGRPKIILETEVQSNKVMQDLELKSFAMEADHSQEVKAASIESDYRSKDGVNLSLSTAVSGMIVPVEDPLGINVSFRLNIEINLSEKLILVSDKIVTALNQLISQAQLTPFEPQTCSAHLKISLSRPGFWHNGVDIKATSGNNGKALKLSGPALKALELESRACQKAIEVETKIAQIKLCLNEYYEGKTKIEIKDGAFVVLNNTSFSPRMRTCFGKINEQKMDKKIIRNMLKFLREEASLDFELQTKFENSRLCAKMINGRMDLDPKKDRDLCGFRDDIIRRVKERHDRDERELIDNQHARQLCEQQFHDQSCLEPFKVSFKPDRSFEPNEEHKSAVATAGGIDEDSVPAPSSYSVARRGDYSEDSRSESESDSRTQERSSSEEPSVLLPRLNSDKLDGDVAAFKKIMSEFQRIAKESNFERQIAMLDSLEDSSLYQNAIENQSPKNIEVITKCMRVSKYKAAQALISPLLGDQRPPLSTGQAHVLDFESHSTSQSLTPIYSGARF